MINNDAKIFFDKLDYLKNSSDRIFIRKKIVKNFLGDLKNLNILDLGCGDGSISLQFLEKNNSITFVDISDKMLEKVKEKIPENKFSNVNFINLPIESLDFQKKFDVILCLGVIAHISSVEVLFHKINAFLKHGGLLVAETTPNPYPIGKILFPYYYLRNYFLGQSQYKKNHLKIGRAHV